MSVVVIESQRIKIINANLVDNSDFILKYSIFFLTSTQSGTPIEISLCYFNNFNHPQRD